MNDKLERMKFRLGNLTSVKVSLLVTVLVGSVLFASMVGYYKFYKLPKDVEVAKQSVVVQNDINAMESVSVVTLNEGAEVQPYTQITDELIQNKMSVKQVPVQFVAEDAVMSLDEVKGMITTGMLAGNQQLSSGLLSTEDDWFGDFDRLKEYTIVNNVGGRVEEGNIVDVVINYGNGDYDVVMTKKKIIDAGVGSQGASEGAAQTVNGNDKLIFEVDEKEFRDMTLAHQLGEFEVRLYRNVEQPASPVTFEYYSKLRKLMVDQGEDFYEDFVDKYGYMHDEDGELVEYEDKEDVEDVENGEDAKKADETPEENQGVTDKTGEDEKEEEKEENTKDSDDESYDEYSVEG